MRLARDAEIFVRESLGWIIKVNVIDNRVEFRATTEQKVQDFVATTQSIGEKTKYRQKAPLPAQRSMTVDEGLQSHAFLDNRNLHPYHHAI